MESIKKIFKIGYGPSSSHTMAPRRASILVRDRNPQAAKFVVTLYGSLAATGRGHLTDIAILDELGSDRTTILWEPKIFLPEHPNGMKFEAFDAEGKILESWTTFSTGGGDISDDGKRHGISESDRIYPDTKMKVILKYCQQKGISFWEYVQMHEESDLWDYLMEVWKVMATSIQEGLDNEGVLPGGLNLPRRASSFLMHAKSYHESMQRRGLLFAYALAVAEQNASGGKIVTAPTCGSCGVLPAVLRTIQKNTEFSDKRVIKALATAGLIGNLIKENASLSGAEVGCQGEVGSACSMASAASVQLYGGSPAQVEYGASMGIEHFLGLTCDPVCGLVQVPCIERNAFAAGRAMDVNQYALMSDGTHLVSFDTVVEAMKQTGHDIPSLYKETSEGGLASIMGPKVEQ